MKIEIHSDTHIEIEYAGGTVSLEYDHAGELADAIRENPERAEELAAIAIATEEDAAVEEAAHAIESARDVCGNERSATIDTLADYGLKATTRLVSRAFHQAENTWADHQADAGVLNPIDDLERADIERALECSA